MTKKKAKHYMTCARWDLELAQEDYVKARRTKDKAREAIAISDMKEAKAKLAHFQRIYL